MRSLAAIAMVLSSVCVAAQAPAPTANPARSISHYATSGPEFTTRFAAFPYPQLFVTGSLEYTGLKNYYEGNPIVADAVAALSEVKVAESLSSKKEAVSRFIAEHPGEPLNAAVLFYHLASFLPAETGPVTLAEFEERIPPWNSLGDAICKGTAAYLYMDQAWQAQAEGDDALALQYFGRCKELSLSVILEYPNDPETTLAIENYSRSAKAEGPESSAECVARLREVVEKNPPSVATWFCRDHIAFITATNKLLKDEQVDQFAKMLEELLQGGFVDEALASPKVSRHTKSDILLMIGHTYFGSRLYDDAELAYERALESCSNQYEWNPRDRGRPIVYDVHYGLRNMTAFSLALARHVQMETTETDTAIAVWQEMSDAFPKGENTDYALFDMGRLQARTGRFEDAKNTFKKIAAEHPGSAVIPLANTELSKITLSAQ